MQDYINNALGELLVKSLLEWYVALLSTNAGSNFFKHLATVRFRVLKHKTVRPQLQELQ